MSDLKNICQLNDKDMSGICPTSNWDVQKRNIKKATGLSNQRDLDSINNKITGDKAEIYFTDVLRKNKFPEFQNEKFIQEGAVWYELANQGYKLRYFNEIIYITEYLEDGLSANPTRMWLENPQGFAFVLKQQIKYYKKNHVRQMSHYSVYYNAVKSKTTFKDAAKYLKISKTFLFISVYVTKTKNKLRSILSTIK